MAELEDMELEQGDDEALEGAESEAREPEQQDGGDEEFSIELEGEQPEDEPELVKKLRTEIRDRDRELSEYRKSSQPKIEVGPEPDLWEDCEGDPDKYKVALLAWTDRKQKADAQEAEGQQQAQVRNQQQQRKFADYRAAAAKMPVPDFEEAEKTVIAGLSDSPDRPLQQALLNYTNNPHQVVYALAKHPARLAAINAEPDIIKAIMMIAETERNLKVSVRKRPAEPESETIQRGSAPIAATSSAKKMEELEKRAAKTGDRTEIIAYKRALKEKAK